LRLSDKINVNEFLDGIDEEGVNGSWYVSSKNEIIALLQIKN
jgi:hypothetical protein